MKRQLPQFVPKDKLNRNFQKTSELQMLGGGNYTHKIFHVNVDVCICIDFEQDCQTLKIWKLQRFFWHLCLLVCMHKILLESCIAGCINFWTFTLVTSWNWYSFVSKCIWLIELKLTFNYQTNPKVMVSSWNIKHDVSEVLKQRFLTIFV